MDVDDGDDDEFVPPGGGAAAGAGDGDGDGDGDAAEEIVLNCDSKLQALVKELRAMRDESANNKALIFSQFNSTLAWLQRRLPEEGFGFRTISGSMPLKQRDKAIQAFQKDPPTTVFLLSMRAGAVGINLTSASHVFLVEPAINPSLTEQAIGRSWRMGQKREVQVKHLIVKDSIESNILKLIADRNKSGKDGDGGKDSEDENADPAVAAAAAAAEATMTKSEIAGHLKADKQRLKREELELLFGIERVEGPVVEEAIAAQDAEMLAA
jgi:superfamily II DNA or RNA helicase